MVRFLIHRPIAVLVSTLALVVLGIITFFQLPVSLLPDIDIPEITIQVNYPAASARQLNQSIVKPIRNQLQQINHLADLEAITQDGLSVIKLRFDYGTNINLAYVERIGAVTFCWIELATCERLIIPVHVVGRVLSLAG